MVSGDRIAVPKANFYFVFALRVAGRSQLQCVVHLELRCKFYWFRSQLWLQLRVVHSHELQPFADSCELRV